MSQPYCSVLIRLMNKKITILLTLLLAVSACTSGPVDMGDSAEGVEEELKEYSIKDLKKVQRKLASAEPDAATPLRLEGANIALKLDLVDLAAELLEPIDASNLGLQEDSHYKILMAGIKLKLEQPVAALEWLNSVDPNTLDRYPKMQILWGHARANAYLQNMDYITSARERVYYDGLLSNTSRQLNHENILQTLTILPLEVLEQAGKEVKKGSEFRGWLSLASLMRENQLDPFSQFTTFVKWQEKWPTHPAALNPPKSLQLLKRIVEDRPNHITLLLPLEGALGKVGRAIRDGILASHFHFIQRHEEFPKISLIDTSNVSMEIAYETAMARGADLIIGPLQRQKILELKETVSLSIPVLALNQIESGSPLEDFFQFGLAPEDEIRQLVDQALMEGFENALAIVPDDSWGSRNLNAFKDFWEKEKGVLVESIAFDKSAKPAKSIRQLLRIDTSESRVSRLRRTLGEKLEFNPRRRRDVDFIFLVANTSEASSINPALGFYYADDVPVYSTSHIHDNTDTRINNMDLKNIRFCEIPFKLKSEQSIQNEVIDSWPGARGILSPFYALGVDAYHLYPRLQQMKLIPGEKLYGTTGIISVDKNNVIRRRLMWAQFKQGKVVQLPLILNTPVIQ